MEPTTVELRQENLEELTSGEGIVLVDCWAAWCRNCEEFAEAFRRAAAKHSAHIFATLDTQSERDLRSALDIQHVPSLVVFRDGLLLFKQPGSFDEAALDDIVAQAETLDMLRVRAELEKARRDATVH